MNKKASVVVGLGFGDEGKGLAIDYLSCQSPNGIIIRYNGGYPSGHTVVTSEGKRHRFSNFGSGTLRGLPTYWSSFCPITPDFLLKEYKQLFAHGVKPKLYIDKQCPIVTHYDLLYNKIIHKAKDPLYLDHQDTDFGPALERHLHSPVKLYAQDLIFPAYCAIKLTYIRAYYIQKIREESDFDFSVYDHVKEDAFFMNSVQEILALLDDSAIQLVNAKEIFSDLYPWDHYIFEGAQGILLDRNYGFFPHIVKCNTTSKNAVALIKQHFKNKPISTAIYYVSRAYHVRHGKGPLPNENLWIDLPDSKASSKPVFRIKNKSRTSPLDLDLLQYALNCDNSFTEGLKKHLLITCVDQVDNAEIKFVKNNQLGSASYKDIQQLLEGNFEEVLFSFHPCAEYLLPTKHISQ